MKRFEDFDWDFDDEDIDSSDIISLNFINYLIVMVGGSTISNKPLYLQVKKLHPMFYEQNYEFKYGLLYKILRTIAIKFKRNEIDEVDTKWLHDINSIVKYKNKDKFNMYTTLNKIEYKFEHGTYDISIEDFIIEYKTHYEDPTI